MDPDSSILVSSLGYIEIDQILSFNGAVLSIEMDCLFQFHYRSILFGWTWTPLYLQNLHSKFTKKKL